MEFKKYQHVERFGTNEVDNIELGECYVFPKIDGTNSSVWLNDKGELRAGSRNKELTFEKDNAGFYKAISENNRIISYLKEHPTHRLYGEWLVPHSLKTYRDDAWRRFYIFDVCIDNGEKNDGIEYIPYDIYQPLLEEYKLDYIMPLKKIKNGNYDSFVHELNNNIFLIKDGSGVGEGVVIKNYNFYNQYGRQTWAKIVTSEFKEKHYKTMGAPKLEVEMIEQNIVNEYCTKAFIEKEYAKIVNEEGLWNSKMIPRLLNTVYHTLIEEEMWNILKKFKSPKINFKALNSLVIGKIKADMPQIFF